MESDRARRAKFQLNRLTASLAQVAGRSVVEIGPGVGHCAYFAFRAGLTDYTTIDLPLGIVARRVFLRKRSTRPNFGSRASNKKSCSKISLFSTARLPTRRYDVALNVDSMTEMSLQAALDYADWISGHASVFLSMNHELNPFTVAEVARHRIAGRMTSRTPWPDRPGYFEETFVIGQKAPAKSGLWWLRTKTLFWNAAVPVRWRIPFLRPSIIPH
jgi:hypothetical protein